MEVAIWMFNKQYHMHKIKLISKRLRFVKKCSGLDSTQVYTHGTNPTKIDVVLSLLKNKNKAIKIINLVDSYSHHK